MKKLIVLISVLFIAQYETFAQTVFELKPSQSMSITGKGVGQDAMKNPYNGQNCFVIVENIGEREFTIRTQQNGEIIELIPIKKGKIKKVKLLKQFELYLDTNSNGIAKAKVEFKKEEE
jgi:hypothetical protein